MVKKFKRTLSIVLTLCVLLSCVAVGSFTAQAGTSVSGVDYGLVDNVQYGNILHCWNWSYNNIRMNLQRIAEQGFTAIQTSPLQSLKESVREGWSTVESQWWTMYQPIGFNVDNAGRGFGTPDELRALCDEAHRYNIKVIVDVVFNHLANDYGHAGTINPQVSDEFKNNMDLWHQPLNYEISNYSDRYDVTHHSLLALPDLNTGHPTVQWYAGNYLKELIYLGVDGFRFDAAKHIETPNDAGGTRSEFWYNVISTATGYAQSERGFTPYYYGEILDDAGIDIGAYTYYMSVTDNGASDNIRNGVLNGNSGAAAQSYSENGAAADRTVLWPESHDDFAASSEYTRTIDSWHINKTWGLVGTRNQNAGLYLARPSNWSSTKVGDADLTAWTSNEVKAVNQFKNRFAGQGEYITSYGSFAYNIRGNSGAAIVNTGQGNSSAWVSVPSHGMQEGTYTDAVTGNQFTVSGGWLYGQMGDSGLAMVYNKGPQVSVHPLTTAYRSDTYTLTLHTENADYGRYSFDNYTYYNFYDGQQITIGADKKVGETTHVYVQSVNMWGEYSNLECYYYWKLSPEREQRVYFDNSDYGYGTCYAYFYHKDTGAEATSWPGIKMSIDDNTDMPYVDVPYGYEGSYCVITDNFTGQNPNNGYGYKLNGETVIVDNGMAWTYYPPKTEGISGDLYLRTDTWGLDGADLKAYVWTGSSNGMADFKSVGTNLYKATLPAGKWKHVNFLRVAPNSSDAVWENLWGQASFMIPTGKNMYTMYDGSWDGSGAWGYYDSSTGDAAVSLVGDFNSWNQDSTVMSATSDGNVVTSTLKLEAGTYSFKLVQGGLWYGNNGTIKDTTTTTSDEGWDMSISANECKLEATGGDYTFNYNKSTHQLTVTYVPAPTDPLPEEGDTSKVSLAGGFNGWDKAATVLTYTSNPDVVTTTMTLEKGTYEFKIVDDALWYGNSNVIKNTTTNLALSITDGNCTLNASGGEYTFNYNISTKKLTVTYVAPAGPEIGSKSTAAVVGDFNKWSKTANVMTYTSSQVASATIALDAGKYTFKIVDSDLWYGNAGVIVDTTSTTSNVGWEMSITDGDCTLQASGGTYTFNYNLSTNMLTVDYVPKPGPSIGDTSTVSVVGGFNGWSKTADKMVYTSSDVVSKTMTLDKGIYSFKIVNGALWYGNSGIIEDTTSATSDVGWEMSITDGDCTLDASGGEYTFDYNVKTNMLSVSYVAPEGPEIGTVSEVSIAGSFNKWDKEDTKLVYTDDTVVSTTMTLDKGTYEFKIVDGGLWYGNSNIIADTTENLALDYSSIGNCVLQASGGDYTFNYDVSTHKLTVTFVEDKSQSVVVGSNSSVALVGSFNGWNSTDSMMKVASADVVTTTMDLDKGTYLFKIIDSYWYGNNGTIEDTTATTSSSGWDMSITDGDCTLKASGGTYTFNYNISTKKLTVLYTPGEDESVEIGSKSEVSLTGSFNSWDKTATMMTYKSNTVVTTKMTLSTGTYTFKVVDGALWYGNGGTIENTTSITSSVGWEMSITEGNCTLEASGGDYTFEYNLETHMLTVTFVPGKQEEVVSNVALVGTFNDWNTTATLMTKKSSNVVTKTLELDAGTYEFKLIDGTWFGNDGTIVDTTAATSSVGWEMNANAGNCTLKASGGSYTFEYNTSTHMLTIYYNK